MPPKPTHSPAMPHSRQPLLPVVLPSVLSAVTVLSLSFSCLDTLKWLPKSQASRVYRTVKMWPELTGTAPPSAFLPPQWLTLTGTLLAWSPQPRTLPSDLRAFSLNSTLSSSHFLSQTRSHWPLSPTSDVYSFGNFLPQKNPGLGGPCIFSQRNPEFSPWQDSAH